MWNYCLGLAGPVNANHDGREPNRNRYEPREPEPREPALWTEPREPEPDFGVEKIEM